MKTAKTATPASNINAQFILESHEQLVSFKFTVVSASEVRVDRFDIDAQRIVSITTMPTKEAKAIYTKVRNTPGFYPVTPRIAPLKVAAADMFKDIIPATKAA